MKDKKIIKVFSMVCILAMMTFGIMGCTTTKLDQQPDRQTQQVKNDEVETEETKNDTVQTEADDSKTGEKPENDEASDEYFDVDEVEDEVDYSKYEEKESETVKPQNGSAVISDGSQTETDQYETEPVPEGQQMPVEPENAQIDKSQEKTCYLTISCATILDNMDQLTAGKEGLVPADGVLYPRTKVTFYEGESVFDILSRETRNNRIHMESNFTPMYNSAYIKGIGNLYEFDCGANSGWMYCVNGWYPNYGVSRYAVQDQDEIIFNYTCDLGRDLGQEWMG